MAGDDLEADTDSQLPTPSSSSSGEPPFVAMVKNWLAQAPQVDPFAPSVVAAPAAPRLSLLLSLLGGGAGIALPPARRSAINFAG
jgi:hypothetical protein